LEEEKEMKKPILPLVNLLAFIVTIVVNGLANALPINGVTTAEVSDSFPVYFVPAGYVFAIWGVIYLALLGFTVYQLLPAQRQSRRLERIGWWFALGCLANSGWIFFWHHRIFPVTLILMLVLLASLLAIYLRLGIGRTTASRTEKWLVDVPFSIYLGWITVATVANVTDVLYYLGWNGAPLSPQVWAAIMLAIATVLAAAMSWTRRDVAYVLVIVWALIGIAVKQAATPLVSWAAWLLAAVALLALGLGVLRRTSSPSASQ
jgi:benzodiazapine receptor